MKAIVYTSSTGYTAAYAKLLSEQTGLPVYNAAEAKKSLAKGTSILYLGWLMAGSVKGYKKAAKRYNIRAVCGVGLGDTGAMLNEVRKANGIPATLPLFTLQGGMDHTKLHGIHKFMINMLTKGLSAKKDRTKAEDRQLALLQAGGNYVCMENLAAVLDWYRAR